jgi:hypothetical protein
MFICIHPDCNNIASNFTKSFKSLFNYDYCFCHCNDHIVSIDNFFYSKLSEEDYIKYIKRIKTNIIK